MTVEEDLPLPVECVRVAEVWLLVTGVGVPLLPLLLTPELVCRVTVAVDVVEFQR